MKYYIPTSNLNLDNILQSECISPISYYPQRLSGYKTYEQIDELRSFNYLVMFRYPISFSINDSGRYNYPVLIEFEDDEQTADCCNNEIQEGVYACVHSLILTPKNCRIFFFSEKAYKLTLINTRSNKTIKYFDAYRIYPDAKQLLLKTIPSLVSAPNIEVGICNDNYIDKQKGVLYGFSLGEKKSINHDLARQLRITQEIYNISTSIASNISSYSSFERELSKLLDEYKKLDSVERRNQELFDKNFNQELGKRFCFLKGCLIEFLNKIGCWDYVSRSLSGKWKCDFLPKMSDLQTKSDFDKLKSELEFRTNSAINEYHKNQTDSYLSDVIIKDNTIEITNAPLVNKVINLVISDGITPEYLYSNRIDFYMSAMKIVVPIIENHIGEDNWVGSKERLFVNNLYSFINDPSCPFNVNSIDNIELRSIAAFILKGQSYNDCMTFCKMAEFEDYRFVLAMWGCLCGYMEMSKDSLSDMLSMSAYKLIYNKLYNRDMVVISAIEDCIHPTENVDFSRKDFSFILETLKYNKDKIQSLTDELELCLTDTTKSHVDTLEKVLNKILPKNATKQKVIAINSFQVLQVSKDRVLLRQTLNQIQASQSATKSIMQYFFSESEKQNKTSVNEMDQQSLFENMKEGFEMTVQYTTGLPVKGVKSIPSKTNYVRGSFNDKPISELMEIIKTECGDLSTTTLKCLQGDLEWILAPKYADKKNTQTLLEELRKHLEEGKVQPIIKKNGESMTFKMKAYKNLDVDKIIECLRRNVK